MQQEGILPDAVTYASILKACSNTGAINKGKELHKDLVCMDYINDLFVSNNLIEMYAQGGNLLDVQKVFNMLAVRNICTWNSVIKACAIHQEGRLAMHYFEGMQEQAVKPDVVTFTCLLTACNRSQLVAEGKKYLLMMRDQYGITPVIDHYTSLIDLLARLGHLNEAEKLLEAVPMSMHDEGMWAALLTACKTHGELDVGERCFHQLADNESESAFTQILTADICKSLRRLEDTVKA
ncbi:hypothetical protein KP509_39G043700 [Ceratopteris richardii]|nr:hypothetical protein KP509_39G043700 [Ceratopteris richardii]